jgi:hypothetical protein
MGSAFGKSIVYRRRFSLWEVNLGCGDGRRINKGLDRTANPMLWPGLLLRIPVLTRSGKQSGFDNAKLLTHCGKEKSIAHSFFSSSGIYQIT